MSYIEEIRQIKNLTMPTIIGICKSLVSDEWKRMPYRHPELCNGISLLESEDAMNAYISAYGEMHYVKCMAAMQNFPYDSLNGSTEIVDWGCGQGIASVSVVQTLRERDKTMWLKKITLVEPSKATLNRAVENCLHSTNGAVKVIPINKYLPSDDKKDSEVYEIPYEYDNVIHLFSNILDITSINLGALAKMIATLGRNHFIVCMGPLNSYSFRIDQFSSMFGQQNYFSDISNRFYSRTSDSFYNFSCKTKCFLYNGEPLVANNHLFEMRPLLIGGRVITNDYEMEFETKEGKCSPLLTNLYHNLSYNLTSEDVLVSKPELMGVYPDILIIEPGRGLVLIDVVSEIVEEYDEKTNKSKFPQINKIFDDRDVILRHLNLNTKEGYVVYRKFLVCDNVPTVELRDSLKGKVYNVDYLFGNDVFTNEQSKRWFLYNVCINRQNNLFDKNQESKIMRLISPKWHHYFEGQKTYLKGPQKTLSVSRAGVKQKITGVTGSGKTQVLAERAVNAQVRTGNNVLVLCYNSTLENYLRRRIENVRASFAIDKIHVYYYHRFVHSFANKYGKKLFFESYDNQHFFDGTIKKEDKFDAIFIDEVQDYQEEWIENVANNFLSDNGEFVVFGDSKQNIFKRELDSKGDIKIGAVIGGLWNHELAKSYRFTNPQIQRLADRFSACFIDIESAQDEVIEQSLTTNIKYALIEKVDNISTLARYCRNIFQHFAFVKDSDTAILSPSSYLLRQLEYEYRQLTGLSTLKSFADLEEIWRCLDEARRSQIGSISNLTEYLRNNRFSTDSLDKQYKNRFDVYSKELKFATIHSFKGWESPTVILFITNENADKGDEDKLIYTALTRAKENLFILNLGNMKYHDFFKHNVHN